MVLDDLDSGTSGTIDYPNVPPDVGFVISGGKATLAELDTILSLEDLWDLIEILNVDAHNARIVRKNRDREGS